MADDRAEATPPFKLVLLVLFVVSLLSLGLLVGLSFGFDNPTETEKAAIDTVDWAFKLTLGGLIGMLTGKAL